MTGNANQKKHSDTADFSGIPALLIPASNEISALYGELGGNVFELMIFRNVNITDEAKIVIASPGRTGLTAGDFMIVRGVPRKNVIRGTMHEQCVVIQT